MINKSTHQCFIRPILPESPKFIEDQNRGLGKNWFYDIETMKVFDEDKNAFFFTPNLVVLKSEEGEHHVFQGPKSRFCEF